MLMMAVRMVMCVRTYDLYVHSYRCLMRSRKRHTPGDRAWYRYLAGCGSKAEGDAFHWEDSGVGVAGIPLLKHRTPKHPQILHTAVVGVQRVTARLCCSGPFRRASAFYLGGDAQGVCACASNLGGRLEPSQAYGTCKNCLVHTIEYCAVNTTLTVPGVYICRIREP